MTEEDVAALSALYSSSSGADWAVNEGWLDGSDGSDACGWRSSEHNEVCSSSADNSTAENSTICCTSDARAEHVFLYSNGLDGTIPTTIGFLTELRSLALHSNELHGGVPTELGLLTALQKLSLHGNALSGLLPTELGRLSDLRVCFLAPGNAWRCPVPEELPAACTPGLVPCTDSPAPPPSPQPPPSPPPSPSYPPPSHPPPSSVGAAGALLIGAALALAILCLFGCAVVVVFLLLRRRIARRRLAEAGREDGPVLSAPPWGEAKSLAASGESGADEEAPRGDDGGSGGSGDIPAASPEPEQAIASEVQPAPAPEPKVEGGVEGAPSPSSAEAVSSPPDATEQQQRAAAQEVEEAAVAGVAVELPAILLEVLQAERLGELCDDWAARGVEERRTKLRDLQRACHPDKHRSSSAAEAAATNAFQHLATLAERAGLARKSPKGRGRGSAPHSRAYGADATAYDGMQHRYAEGERPEL